MTQYKAVPFFDLTLSASFFKNLALAQQQAKTVDYNFLLFMAEKDHIVCNKATRQWYDNTPSKEKTLKLLPRFYHELAKEPDKDVKVWKPIFEYVSK